MAMKWTGKVVGGILGAMTLGPIGVAAQPASNATVATEKVRRLAATRQTDITPISSRNFKLTKGNSFTGSMQKALPHSNWNQYDIFIL